MKSVISFVLASLLLLTSSYSFSAQLIRYSGATDWYPTYEIACQALDDFFTDDTYTSLSGTSCIRYNSLGSPISTYQPFYKSGDCPSGYEEGEDGYCHIVEPDQCPAGQFDYGSGCEDMCVKGTERTATFVCGSEASLSPIFSTGDGGSCAYEFLSFDETQVSVGQNTAYCTLNYVATGEYIPNLEPDDVDIPNDLEPSTDSRVSDSDTTISSSEPVVNPDGSISQTETKTITKTSGSGFNVIDGDNTITIRDTDGTITVYTENKTTVTHPDGSITETINQDTNTTTSPVNNTVITKNPPSITNITNEGSTTYYNQTVVNQYDSSGNLTSSTTTQNGSGTSGDGGDSEKEGNCGAPGQPVCQVELSDNSDEYSDQYTRISQQESELADIRQKVVDELADTSEDYGLSGIIDFSVESLVTNFLPLPDSYTCNGITTTFLDGKVFEFEPCEDLQPLREVLAWVFFIYTLFAVHNVLLGRRLF